MFSATFPKEARALARRYMAKDHVRVRVGRIGSTHDNVMQRVGGHVQNLGGRGSDTCDRRSSTWKSQRSVNAFLICFSRCRLPAQ